MPAHKKRININLIERKTDEESFSSQILSWAFTYGRYIIIITQIVVLSVFFLRFRLDRDHADLKESVAQKQAILESVTDLETEIRRIQTKIADIRKITSQQELPLKLLRFLQENTPVDTSYTTISLSDNGVVFTATAESLRSFSSLLKKLQQDNKFTEVILNDIQRKKNGLIEFKITAKININLLLQS